MIKVHLEAVKYARDGYTIVLIGHEGHDEVIGTMGEAPNQMILVETARDVEQLVVPDPNKVAYLTQTTLSVDDANIVIAALATGSLTSPIPRRTTSATRPRIVKRPYVSWRLKRIWCSSGESEQLEQQAARRDRQRAGYPVILDRWR